MKREVGRRGNSESRIQNPEFRIQNSEWGRWVAGLVLAAAAGCASPKAAQFTDADWVSYSATARGCYERGDYRRAADAYGRAEQRAVALDEADALAISAVNRAVCLLADGKAEEARAGVARALADGRVTIVRRTELLAAGARAELALGHLDEANGLSAAALALEPSNLLRAQVVLVQSGVQVAKKDPAAAATALSNGLSVKDWARLPEALRAEEAMRRAEIAVAENRPAEAVKQQDAAAELWKKAGRLPEMAKALAEAGRQARAAGNLPGACDRLYRASRSQWAQGLQAEAVRTLEEGVACAEELKDEAMGKRMAELFVTYKDGKRLTE